MAWDSRRIERLAAPATREPAAESLRGAGTSTDTGDRVRFSGRLCPAASVNSCLVVV